MIWSLFKLFGWLGYHRDFTGGMQYLLDYARLRAFEAQDESYSSDSCTVSCFKEKFVRLADLEMLFKARARRLVR